MLERYFSGRNTENHFRKFILCILQINPIESKENKHGMCADSFISIYKGVVLNQPVSKTSRLLLQ